MTASLAVVTGATGHLGANLVQSLLAAGRRVRAVARGSQNLARLKALGAETFAADILDRPAIQAACEGAGAVYHLAGRISIDGDPQGLVWRVNVLGTRNVVNACIEAKVGRLIHFSSVHALDVHAVEMIDESRPLALSAPAPLYDQSKAEAELEVFAGLSRGLRAVILSPGGVIGPLDWQPSRMGRFLSDVGRGRVPWGIGGGFSWVDARDVAQASIRAETQARDGERYLLVGPYAPVSRVVEATARLAGVRPPRSQIPLALARLAAPAATWWARMSGREPLFTLESLRAISGPPISAQKAERELGFLPRPLDETLFDTWRWWAAEGPP